MTEEEEQEEEETELSGSGNMIHELPCIHYIGRTILPGTDKINESELRIVGLSLKEAYTIFVNVAERMKMDVKINPKEIKKE